MTKAETPFLGFYLIVRDAAKTIIPLLESIHEAWDELVVVDTGSVDETRELVADYLMQSFGLTGPRPDPDWLPPPAKGLELVNEDPSDPARVVLARFDWIDDFAAARNFAFGLGTATWRGYLDADDVFPQAGELRRELRRIEEERPEVNCLAIPYQYSDVVLQDKHRVFRWADGWAWRDPIHEHCDRIGGARMISVAKWLTVQHAKTPAESLKSFQRNFRIAQGAHDRAVARGDQATAATMRYYLARDHASLALEPGLKLDDPEEALTPKEHLDEAVKGFSYVSSAMAFSNFAALAEVELARLGLETGNPDGAALNAATAIAHAGENPEGYLMLGIAHRRRKDYERAVLAFDHAFGRPSANPFRTVNDRDLTEGLARIEAALAYVHVGRLDDAEKHLNAVPRELVAVFRREWADAASALGKARLLAAFSRYLEALCWDAQPLDALRLFERAPAALDGLPALAAMKRKLLSKLTHRRSFQAYKDVYASIPLAQYHVAPEQRAQVLELGRHKALLEWARETAPVWECPKCKERSSYPFTHEAAPPCGGLPARCVTPGRVLKLLSVGFQDGIVESACLKANYKLEVVVVDVAEQASKGYLELEAAFPGRVRRHVMQAITDWHPDAETGTFDAAACFEVIEHLPVPHAGLLELYSALKFGGKLFLSTPVADRWIEPYLTGPQAPPHYWHLHAFSPLRLERELCEAGFPGGRLEATEAAGVFLAKREKAEAIAGHDGSIRIGIYVHSTPHPFDPDTHKARHLGGSEEAVIHLSAALARWGAKVTVYSERPRRADGKVVHAHAGVLWREVEGFDLSGDDHDAVLFWRYPAAMLDTRVKAAPYVKLLWLHDTNYEAPRAAYEAADAVIVLSQFHAKVLAELEDLGAVCFTGDGEDRRSLVAKRSGVEGIRLRVAQNGIDLDAFPPLTDEDEALRDAKKVIYASSPDRGLERLLHVWPSVRVFVPDATLDVYYTWDLFEARQPERAKALRMEAERLANVGVTLKGGVDHATLHLAYRRAGVWAYPTSFPEISCISAMKALASGVTCATSRFAALDETLGPWGRQVRNPEADVGTQAGIESFTRDLVDCLTEPDAASKRRDQSQWARAAYSWDVAARRFVEIAKEALDRKRGIQRRVPFDAKVAR